MSSGGLWSGLYYAGIAMVIAVDVAFPGWAVVSALLIVLAGYGWLYRKSMQAIDEWYERVDRDAG